MIEKPHLSFELQPKPKNRKTEIWTVVDQSEYRLGCVSWWAPWRRYTFRPDSNTIYDPGCLRLIADFCYSVTVERKKVRALEKNPELPPCMSYCGHEAPHKGACVPTGGR